MLISSDFDGGNIVDISSNDPQNIRLEIRKDNQSDFYQWFYYQLSGAKSQACVMKIENAKGAAFTGGWENYNACASYNRQSWFRVPTKFENGELVIEHTPEHDEICYAYFAPYSMQQHAELIAKAQSNPGVTASIMGQTLDGQDMDLLTIGTPGADKKNMWVIARQHPGETMAEWWMEGFLDRLLDKNDAVAAALRENSVFYVVPNMNPDGSKRGHLRTNAVGANENREWGITTNVALKSSWSWKKCKKQALIFALMYTGMKRCRIILSQARRACRVLIKKVKIYWTGLNQPM